MSVLARNHVQLTGSGSQAMVFVHGFGCDQNVWRFLVPAFSERYRIVLFDHVGAGKSSLAAYSGTRYATLRGYAEDVVEVCDELELTGSVLVAHSVGAMIGLLASVQKPSLFSQLILLTPSPCYLNDGSYRGGFDRKDIDQLLDAMDDNYLGWSSTMAPVIMGNPDRPELGEELTNSFCRTDPAIAREFGRVVFLSDTRADLPAVSIPALILQCQNDPIAPLSAGDYTHSQLRDSQLVQMKATGHCPHLSAPQETIAAMRDFLGA